MNDISENTPKLNYELDYHGKDILLKLARWSKFVGLINIAFGFIYCLTIFIFSIPTVIIGIFLILIGTRLTSVAGNLNYCVLHEESASFSEALDQLRSYMFLYGTMMIVMVVIIIILIIIAITFGVAVKDFFFEAADDIVIRSLLSQLI